MESRNEIFDSVKKNIGNKDFDLPDIPVFEKSGRPLLEEFKENLEAAAGTWQEVSGTEEAYERIRKLFPDAKTVCSATYEIQGNKSVSKAEDPKDMQDVDVGVVRSGLGVASNGMVYLGGKDLKVNSLGVLSQHLVILLDPDKIVADLYEAYAEIDLESDPYGCFMLGPSATADIGVEMVRGAQGARSLTVFFMK